MVSRTDELKAELRSLVGAVNVIDSGESLETLSKDFYWYSPVLKRQLDDKTADAADTTLWKTAPDLSDKPLMVSEFGGSAKAGLHGPVTQRWTEEYQANIYRHQIPMLHKIPHLRGSSAWILMDFRSPIRVLPNIQDGFNRKGLISDKGQKKAAFYVLQKAYKDNALGHAE